MTRRNKFHRCEIYEGPDRHGNYHYALFWMADYHPGHPEGENVIRERAQHFRTKLPEDVPTEDKRR